MRLPTALACLFAVVFLAAPPAVADRQQPGRVDVRAAIARLATEPIVRMPGAVARFDEARVRAEMTPGMRLLVLPYVDHELYSDASGDSRYYDLVLGPLQDWAHEEKRPLVVVEGLSTHVYEAMSDIDDDLPADLPELRATASTMDVTERLVTVARRARDLPDQQVADPGFAYPEPVAPAPGQLDAVTNALRANAVHNGPGRAGPVAESITERAAKLGLTVRVAAFPYLAPGQPVVDYATPLGQAFPGDVVLVLHGDWIDIAAPDQRKALAARDFAYGDADLGLFPSGSDAGYLLRQVLERYALLVAETAYGHPQPPEQPRRLPFDVRGTVAAFAPWVLVGSAVVLAGAVLVRHRSRQASAAADEERDLRIESAAAMAAIGDLGARLLAVEEGGATADPAAAERHATARQLYDQALTSVAMVEVRRVAEEGAELLAEPPPAEPGRTGKKRRAKKTGRRASGGHRSVTWRRSR